MLETGNMDLNELPKKKKYPWNILNKKGDFFIWENLDDAQKIRSAGYFQNFKIRCIKNEGKLLVVRA